MAQQECIDILDVSGVADALADLPGGIGGLCGVVQGLLIHDGAVSTLYGQPPPGFPIDRETKPVSERIDLARRRHPLSPTAPRPPFERQVGTCRDFATMLCAFSRHRGFEARVRCGYGRYLGAPLFEDHWIIEYRRQVSDAWKFADAQMDSAHRAYLALDFDHTDVPQGAFITADRAWSLWRTGALPATDFGHGEHRGERFMFVNLVRDALARSDVLRSQWDAWRELGDLSRALPEDAIELGDDLDAGERSAFDHILHAEPALLLDPT